MASTDSSSGRPIRVLLVEDSEDDAFLLLREIRRGGYAPEARRVDSASDMRDALQSGGWDLITCDWVLPGFSAPTALEMIRESGVDAPVIIVSGEVDEEVTVGALQRGARDFISKHRLARLVPAIERELRDVVSRRQQALLQEAYRAVVEDAPQGFAILLDDRVAFANPALERMSGYSRDELSGFAVRDLLACVHPADRDPVVERIGRLVAREGGDSPVEARAYRKDGALRWVEVQALPIHYDGRPAVQLAFFDITERRRTEEALEQAREHVRLMLEQVPLVLWTTDRDLRVTSSSGGALGNLGLQSGELVGSTVGEYHGTDDSDFVPLAMHRSALAGNSMRYEFEWAGRLFNTRLEPLRDRGGEVVGVVGVAEDITGQRRLERHLHAAQRLEAVGRLAGGVAHEFNNQLMVIQGSLQRLSAQLPEEGSQRRDVERIAASAEKGADLARQLLQFSARHPVETRAIDLNDLLSSMTPILRLLLGEQIQLRVQTAAHHTVRADRSQLEQVVMNLVSNARDAAASTADALVAVATADAELDELVPDFSDAPQSDQYVMLSVTDNGAGMADHVYEHIFEPYYTTKSSSSGLGLATVHGIVRQHGGYVVCESVRGRGTVVRVYLPAVDGDAQDEAAAERRTPRRAAVAERPLVLLVDDDERVREVLAEYLADVGYEVRSASGADEALALAGRLTRSPDILVADVFMPRTSGLSLARRLLANHPDIGVVFMSGYITDRGGDLPLPQRARFLPKPFSLDDLQRCLRELLER